MAYLNHGGKLVPIRRDLSQKLSKNKYTQMKWKCVFCCTIYACIKRCDFQGYTLAVTCWQGVLLDINRHEMNVNCMTIESLNLDSKKFLKSFLHGHLRLILKKSWGPALLVYRQRAIFFFFISMSLKKSDFGDFLALILQTPPWKPIFRQQYLRKY